MSKRRLSKRQLARISDQQQNELAARSGDATGSSDAAQNKCNGRIISHFGQHLDVESLDPAHEGRVIRCHQRANLPKLVTGDLVVWEQEGSDSGIILAQGERRNVFGRSNYEGILKPVAANIDLVLVVFASAPTPHMSLIDRYLVSIENLGLQPLLILNKSDLLEGQNHEELDNMLSIYPEIGYALHRVSAESGFGLDQLGQALNGKTTVLVGQSGVGKSSLINCLAPEAVAAVGGLSAAWDRGTHTTTTSRLFHLSSFDLIDSPGIREFGLGHINQQQVFDGFIEFRPFAGLCKFRDCSHKTEPDCAIQMAAQSGEISRARLDSYFRILSTLGES